MTKPLIDSRPARALRWRWFAAAGAGGAALVALVAAAVVSHGLSVADAALLGVVEGVTEFLPVSSTGHLTVVERLLGLGRTASDRRAADAYAICIQAGAIVAIAVLYRRRLAAMVAGLRGRDRVGRRLSGTLLAAFVPAAVLGGILGATIQDRLFGVGPVAVAWAVGGIAILLLVPRWSTGQRQLEALCLRDGVVIGLAQTLALWPGVSRSLVTILAGLGLGLAGPAAVEFSFLLGLVTLGAATAFEAVTDGSVIVDRFGLSSPVVGLLFAFVSAVVAVRWLIGYLNRHGLAVFGWYRLAAAGAAVLLLAVNAV